ncbi:hypothetical protein HY02_06725 [Peptococcaceae bacterium SCADC1_2_3]|nr:hypothetical protein DK28_0215055 [Peptococcaceae bacterium SCADC1_2_3]KFI38192.1 hypothetical protein HY02_06725 [Peptococcaceae bacterium SCADC1_2_3]
MGLFLSIEGSLEKYIEKFFHDKYKGRVHPLEIAKKLTREMRDRKRVSINHTYVPNKYLVYLYPEDLQAVIPIVPLLTRELKDYVEKKAAEKKHILIAPPQIFFQADENLETGQLHVEGSFEEVKINKGVGVENEPPLAEKKEEDEKNTLCFKPIKNVIPAQNNFPEPKGQLILNTGTAVGKTFYLKTSPMIIGRHDSCDIILNDHSVSRHQAKIEYQQGKYILTDLESTNGTFVNGKKITTHPLKAGDTIKAGTSLLLFNFLP